MSLTTQVTVSNIQNILSLEEETAPNTYRTVVVIAITSKVRC